MSRTCDRELTPLDEFFEVEFVQPSSSSEIDENLTSSVQIIFSLNKAENNDSYVKVLKAYNLMKQNLVICLEKVFYYVESGAPTLFSPRPGMAQLLGEVSKNFNVIVLSNYNAQTVERVLSYTNVLDSINAIFTADYRAREDNSYGELYLEEKLDISLVYTIFLTCESKIFSLSAEDSNILCVREFDNDTADNKLEKLIPFFEYLIKMNVDPFPIQETFCEFKKVQLGKRRKNLSFSKVKISENISDGEIDDASPIGSLMSSLTRWSNTSERKMSFRKSSLFEQTNSL